MLKNWTTHIDYQKILISNISSIFTSEPNRISFMAPIISKLFILNLDPLRSILEPFYSNTGKPAKNQPEIFRSFILMLFLGETSITNWVTLLQ